ncbi:MAG: RNA polymerase sigma factor [Pirellulaceae bacterium]
MATPSDQSEFLQMDDDHGAAVLAMLRRLCGNMPDAEDAFQETAVRVWKRPRQSPLVDSA